MESITWIQDELIITTLPRVCMSVLFLKIAPLTDFACNISAKEYTSKINTI